MSFSLGEGVASVFSVNEVKEVWSLCLSVPFIEEEMWLLSLRQSQ